MNDHRMTDDVRRVLTHHAESLTPQRGWAGSVDELLQRPDTKPAQRRPRRALAYLPAIAAAAAICLIVIPIGLATHSGQAGSVPAAAAPGLHTDGPVATLAGAHFPIPAGWDIEAIDRGPDVAAACISPRPQSANDCDGVTVSVARADPATGSYRPIDSPVVTAAAAECTRIQLLAATTVAGLSADEYSVACTQAGASALSWYVTDGSLLISTSPGLGHKQGAHIAQAITLDHSRFRSPTVPLAQRTGPAGLTPPR